MINPVILDGALWVTIPIALLAGLVSFLSPCVLPLVPGYLGFIGGAVGAQPQAAAADAKRGRSRLLLGVLLFILGFTLVFVTIMVIGGAMGAWLLRWTDLITRVMGVLVILLGLVFIGLFGMMQRTVKMRVDGVAGTIGAPLLGVAFAIGWTPCMGPTLAAIMAVSWNLGDPGRAALLGLAYSLGLGIPFLLLALGLGWATRSVAFVRRHIRTVNIIGGALLIVVGVLMVSGVWTTMINSLGAMLQTVELPL